MDLIVTCRKAHNNSVSQKKMLGKLRKRHKKMLGKLRKRHKKMLGNKKKMLGKLRKRHKKMLGKLRKRHKKAPQITQDALMWASN